MVSMGLIVGSVLGVMVLLMIVLVLLFRRGLQQRKQFPGIGDVEAGYGAPWQAFLCRRRRWYCMRWFDLTELQEATKNFHEDGLIGHGGFGKVYRGKLRDGTEVAVKRKDPNADQGYTEFLTEIKLLSLLRHRHVVSLLGFCQERKEMILVYELMEQGTLHSHLHKSNNNVLTWKQRLEICIGAARGLHFLHNSTEKGVIHRDVKPANILLDRKLHAKVADVGISRIGHGLDISHVTTEVKGTFGYLDPEYHSKQQLTEKSDVYSFGVVLLEVLCAKRPYDREFPWKMVMRRKPRQIIDPRISGTIKTASLNMFVKLVDKCLADDGADRPSMEDVVMDLKLALMFQDKNYESPEMGYRFGYKPRSRLELWSRGQNLVTLEAIEENLEEGPDEDDIYELSKLPAHRIFSLTLAEAQGRMQKC